MAKVKGQKGTGGGANSHLRARLSYLYNAAIYLQNAAKQSKNDDIDNTGNSGEVKMMSTPSRIVPHVMDSSTVSGKDSLCGSGTEKSGVPLPQISRVCISQMRGVSLKSQLRLPIEQKRSFCKRCDTLLITGANCTQEIRNASRGAKKPWADVRIVRCNTCGTEKRFPQTERRSKKLSQRKKEQKEQKSSEQGHPAAPA
ncbi:hypothetical protein P175DRAFT_0534666 [Aspergillus ochraceoroseus IBT 24754]|uniref:Rpr2-domain-containing protein n=2 Tax=Aspergillus ochraceoroseus TaxID=138278 RepID=A0A2T5LRH9_9EURO|nr:uncharacterized protein P175DRAFT_0534666 [Aspergillus ochraceoroseus IBT 24754]KKK20414.1 hypothetical protein AOCH_006834 [Aspergillus ochraceoroseus]PTU18885.1 hypothetical protein P175DRAFT_0534666 [Aspergillus ochraceoroseus IBT 24754]